MSATQVEVDGLRIHVAVAGQGTPLLLIMGLGGHLGMWHPFQDLLHDFETIAYDAPGTGRSSMPAIPLRMSQLAGMTVRLLDILGYREVDVMGLSYGGALAQELTRRAPHCVRRLVLAATACGVGSVPGNPLVLMRLADPTRYYSRSVFESDAPFVFGGRLRTDPDLIRQAAAIWRAYPPTPVGYLSQLYSLYGWSSLPWLHMIEQPTLVLSGDDDPIVPLVNGKILASRIPNARLHVVPGGHLFLLEQGRQVASLVRRFLTPEGQA